MTIAIDNASFNDLAIKYLQKMINHSSGSAWGSDYLDIRWATHILNLIVNDGLKDLDVSIMKICDVIIKVCEVFSF